MGRLSLFTIPPHRAFADALAAGLAATHGGSELGLASGIVLVANNRAARALRDAFVRRAGGGLLLPRLLPIGDPDLGERVGGALDPILDEDEAIPPAIDPTLRLILLARLVVEHRPGIDPGEALRLAADLGRTLDQLRIEQVDPARLGDFAVELPDLSHHWQASLDRLTLILDAWPKLLAERGEIDLAERRNRVLGALTRRWRRAPPEGFVASAGISTAAPAVASLLAAVATMPHGVVVFPGLDLGMPEAQWAALGPHLPDPGTGLARPSIETHPQFQLKLLLERMGAGRAEVERWRWGGRPGSRASRARAISNAMAPARYTAGWQDLPPSERRITGVRALELADPGEESQAIALALRQALEEPGRTAALVTPDRALARRVAAHLARWGIEADDSAGVALSAKPAGTLLRAAAAAAIEDFAPVALLALVKHPLVRKGEGRLDWLDKVRALDLALRGPRPAPGLAGISAFLSEPWVWRDHDRAQAERAWGDIRPSLEPLADVFARTAAGLPPLLAAIRDCATELSAGAVWSGVDGRAAADLFERLESAAESLPGDPGALMPLLDLLMDETAIRASFGRHPRIFIWGLLEARLQSADLVVLGGLNEGIWPPAPAPDPWLAPRLRRELGLPGLDRRIGLAAHDFASALGASSVLVTRARRDARSAVVASRFWLRLEAMTGGMTRARGLGLWARTMDRAAPGSVPRARRPQPAPPPEARPRTVSVTQVDGLAADPFAFYAQHILRLRALDPLDAEPSAAWRGSAVHTMLDAWMREDGCDPAALRPRGEALLEDEAVHPLMRALWKPRLLEVMDNFAGLTADMLAEGRMPMASEISGQIEVGGVRLKGRADRIDLLPGGGVAILDYKTGQAPSIAKVKEGFATQLGLLGLIAREGGFEGVPPAPELFEYWCFARASDGTLGHVALPWDKREHFDPVAFVARAKGQFLEAAAKWLTGTEPFRALRKPEYAFTDYNQLMRLAEWLGEAAPTGSPVGAAEASGSA